MALEVGIAAVVAEGPDHINAIRRGACASGIFPIPMKVAWIVMHDGDPLRLCGKNFEEWAAQCDCKLVGLATASATAFYERLGYASKAGYYKISEPST